MSLVIHLCLLGSSCPLVVFYINELFKCMHLQVHLGSQFPPYLLSLIPHVFLQVQPSKCLI
jgi:hypothetical protein